MQKVIRCKWANSSKEMQDYHDNEWGVPVHNDRIHFEFLILEAAQAGLSWSTILNRRNGYKNAFADFDPVKVSKFDNLKIRELMANPKIIRNKLKILSAINNARQFIKIQNEFGTFDNYIWGFVDNKPINNRLNSVEQMLAKSDLSEKISKDLKKRGFRFVGPTIVYFYMRAVGIANDHTTRCWCYKKCSETKRLADSSKKPNKQNQQNK
ncbi:DNA-3-methyladenine glycosylase I [Gammaproteobacteria bacterium]